MELYFGKSPTATLIAACHHSASCRNCNAGSWCCIFERSKTRTRRTSNHISRSVPARTHFIPRARRCVRLEAGRRLCRVHGVILFFFTSRAHSSGLLGASAHSTAVAYELISQQRRASTNIGVDHSIKDLLITNM